MNPKHPIDRGAPASIIVDKFGGLKSYAEAMSEVRLERGESPLSMSTVHRWLVKGHIDGKYHDDTNDAARRRSVRLKPADYVDQRKPEDRGAVGAELAAVAG